METCTNLAQFGTSLYQNWNISVLREETEQNRIETEEKREEHVRFRTKETPMELDALEAVRRLTMERDALAERVEHLKSDMEKKQEFVNRVCNERDALANELDAVKDDLRVSLQTLDSIRAATGMYSYGHHLAKSLKAMKEDRDALAEQVKRLEDSVTWHREELERTRAEWEQQENARRAHERRERHETGTEPTEGPNGAPRGCNADSQTCERCRHGRHSLCDKMVCTRHAPKHGERMGERGFWPLVSREDACGDWEAK